MLTFIFECYNDTATLTNLNAEGQPFSILTVKPQVNLYTVEFTTNEIDEQIYQAFGLLVQYYDFTQWIGLTHIPVKLRVMEDAIKIETIVKYPPVLEESIIAVQLFTQLVIFRGFALNTYMRER